MEPDRWKEIERLYHLARELDPGRRQAFLEEACGGDVPLLREVESLLACRPQAEDFIESPALDVAAGIIAGSSPSPQESDLTGRTLLHYRIEEKIGEGGMGAVYRAHDEHLDRDVAVKVLSAGTFADEPARKRFRKEALALSKLSHPNIETVFDFDTQDGIDFLVMEYIPGQTLGEKLAGGSLPEKEISKLGAQLAEGLAAAHDQGIVHRDLKPGNVLVTPDGRLKILDFGLAKLVRPPGEHATRESITEASAIAGTLPYMAPEQLRGETIDARTDIYAAGTILYEMSTGRLPFEAKISPALAGDILHTDPPQPGQLNPAISVRLEKLILNCLEKDPGNRCRSARELAVDLQRLGMPDSSPRAQGPGPRRKPHRVAILAAGSAAIVMLAVLFALNVGGWRDRLLGNAGTSPPRSIAVLPFANLGGDQDDEYFSDGITVDIISHLSKIEGLEKVISSASTMQYKNSPKSLREIGRELDVNSILTGNVRRGANLVRIVVELSDANTGQILWANPYDRKPGEIFAVQSDIALKVAAALRVELGAEEMERVEKKPTEDLTAYDLYLKGREYWYRFRKNDNDNAIELFKRALELDPDYALAHAWLSGAYSFGVLLFGFPPGFIDRAIETAQKAVDLDPDLADAHWALGHAYARKGWMRKALEEGNKAVQLDPNHYQTCSLLAFTHRFIGQIDEAFAWAKRAVALNPRSYERYQAIGYLYWDLADYERAEASAQKILEVDPDSTFAYPLLILTYLMQDRFDKAEQVSNRIISLYPENTQAWGCAGLAAVWIGDHVKAQEYLEKAIRMGPTSSGRTVVHSTWLGYIYWKTGRRKLAEKMFAQSLQFNRARIEAGDQSSFPSFDLAFVYAIQGRKKEAYEWLQKAIDAGNRWYYLLLRHPLLENLHHDQEFIQMMKQLKAEVDRMRRNVEVMEGREM